MREGRLCQVQLCYLNLFQFLASFSSVKWLSDMPKWPMILEVFRTVLVHRGALGDSPSSFPSGTAPPNSTGCWKPALVSVHWLLLLPTPLLSRALGRAE